MRGDLLEDGEDGREDEVEGSQCGDGPGRDSKGAIQVWVWIPHIGHSKSQHPPVDEEFKYLISSHKLFITFAMHYNKGPHLWLHHSSA